jgi:hypothetical protein
LQKKLLVIGWQIAVIRSNFISRSEVDFMSTVHQGENAGLKGPYRTLLILFWGMLMALAALAGQMGGQEDFLPGQSVSGGNRPRLEKVQALHEKSSRPKPFSGY